MVNDAPSLGKILIIDFVEWWGCFFVLCLFLFLIYNLGGNRKLGARPGYEHFV